MYVYGVCVCVCVCVYIYIYMSIYTLRNEGEKVIYILSCFSHAQLFATLQAITH